MPVRYVRVSPGDGSEGYQPGAGSYPNHRGKVDVDSGTAVDLQEACADDAASAAHFGVSPEACAKRDFRYRHFYNCPSGSENVLPTCSGGANPANNSFDALLNDKGCWDPNESGGACVFRPRVQMQRIAHPQMTAIPSGMAVGMLHTDEVMSEGLRGADMMSYGRKRSWTVATRMVSTEIARAESV